MPKTHFTADLHFWHKKVCLYSHRPFVASVEEMNEALIENWNRTVKLGDDVYLLGDFCFGSKEQALGIRQRLQGNIFFIHGNHDAAAHQIRSKFCWDKPVAMIKVNEQLIWLSHYAHRVWDRSHYGSIHLYGHSHGTLPEPLDTLSMDVGVDATARRLGGFACGGNVYPALNPRDYRPISFEEVKAEMATRAFKPVERRPDELEK